MNRYAHAQGPRCGRRSSRSGRWGYCSISRPRTRAGFYLPACLAHLTTEERKAYGLVPGCAPRPRQTEIDLAKIRAGDRD